MKAEPLALLAVLAWAVTGCVSSAPTNSVIVHCLPLIAWAPADQDELKREYDLMPAPWKMKLAFRDYIAMRDADRACLGAQSKGG